MIVQPQPTFYAQHGPLTDPKQHAHLLAGLPTDVPALVDALQNLVVHIFWAQRYGIGLSDERKAEVQLRSVARKLARMQELDDRPLTEPRPLENRLVSNCRDFSVLMAGMLRQQGVPARARCGFGTYFTPGKFEDHWVCEYWHAQEGRWVMVDAQLDALQREVLGIRFNPLDMPPGQFVLAGAAWQMCRREGANPDDFGIFEWHGWDFIRGNVFREVLSLNRVELLPWDYWGLMETPVAQCSPEQLALVDQAAELTLHVDACFEELRSFYTIHTRLHAPEDWLA